MASIKFEHVTRRDTDGFEAVRDMSLEVRDGEFMLPVGPSGSGKPTALRMVAGARRKLRGGREKGTGGR